MKGDFLVLEGPEKNRTGSRAYARFPISILVILLSLLQVIPVQFVQTRLSFIHVAGRWPLKELLTKSQKRNCCLSNRLRVVQHAWMRVKEVAERARTSSTIGESQHQMHQRQVAAHKGRPPRWSQLKCTALNFTPFYKFLETPVYCDVCLVWRNARHRHVTTRFLGVAPL
jgi:hypothetical protein